MSISPIVIAHATGGHETVIEEGTKLLTNNSTIKQSDKQKVLVYMWLAAMALGDKNPLQRFTKFKAVLDGNLRECLGLLTVVLLHKSSGATTEQEAQNIQKATELSQNADEASKYTLSYALLEAGAIERAFELIRRQDDDPDCQVLIVRMLMGLRRVDGARVRVEEMRQRFGADEVRVQAAEACLIQPFESDERAVRYAIYTCQELAELYGATNKLILTQAICLERLGKMEEARNLLDRHLSEKADANLLANCLFAATKRDQIDTLKARLYATSPSHPLLDAIQRAQAVFGGEF